MILDVSLKKTKPNSTAFFSKTKMVTSRYCWTQGANHGGSWVSRKGIGKQPPLGRAMGDETMESRNLGGEARCHMAAVEGEAYEEVSLPVYPETNRT